MSAPAQDSSVSILEFFLRRDQNFLDSGPSDPNSVHIITKSINWYILLTKKVGNIKVERTKLRLAQTINTYVKCPLSPFFTYGIAFCNESFSIFTMLFKIYSVNSVLMATSYWIIYLITSCKSFHFFPCCHQYKKCLANIFVHTVFNYFFPRFSFCGKLEVGLLFKDVRIPNTNG
jgi:hypothetical protein